MSTTAPMPAPPAETPREARLTLAIASLAVLAVFLDTTVLFVAFPDIVATFDSVAPAQLSWVLNAYTIVFAALLVPAGRFADRLGHKRASCSARRCSRSRRWPAGWRRRPAS